MTNNIGNNYLALNVTVKTFSGLTYFYSMRVDAFDGSSWSTLSTGNVEEGGFYDASKELEELMKEEGISADIPVNGVNISVAKKSYL